MFGGPEDQEPEKIEIPVTVERPPTSVSIGCHEYLMGTTAPNSFALLRVRQTGAETISVDVEFVDHAADRLALCERDHGGHKPRIREGMPCQLSFSLSRR